MILDRGLRPFIGGENISGVVGQNSDDPRQGTKTISCERARFGQLGGRTAMILDRGLRPYQQSRLLPHSPRGRTAMILDRGLRPIEHMLEPIHLGLGRTAMILDRGLRPTNNITIMVRMDFGRTAMILDRGLRHQSNGFIRCFSPPRGRTAMILDRGLRRKRLPALHRSSHSGQNSDDPRQGTKTSSSPIQAPGQSWGRTAMILDRGLRPGYPRHVKEQGSVGRTAMILDRGLRPIQRFYPLFFSTAGRTAMILDRGLRLTSSRVTCALISPVRQNSDDPRQGTKTTVLLRPTT